MAAAHIHYEKQNSVGWFMFNRPPANALNLDLVLEASGLLDAIAIDTEVRCLVVGSKVPGVFMAGADIKMMKAYAKGGTLREDMIRFNTALQAMINKIEDMPKPVIAALNGHALGGGLELALACDLRYMAKGKGRIGLTEVRLGLLPGAGGTQRLSRTIGRTRAKEIIFESTMLDAEEALAGGIVHCIFADEAELFSQVRTKAEGFATRATVALAVVKRCINQGVDLKICEGLAMEMNGLAELIETEDLVEGVSAFLEKREPQFKGR